MSAKPRLLIIEDNPVNLDLVTQLLEDDYELVTAADGAAGLAAFESHAPALCIIDLSLPVMDGWEVIRRIRQAPRRSQTPIIALSAHAHQEDIERALRAGCDTYLTKPVDETALLGMIPKLLAKAPR